MAATLDTLEGIKIFRENARHNKGMPWDRLIKDFDDPNKIPVRVMQERVINNGTFSNKEIIAAIALGQIVQYPYNPDLIGPTSVDTQLGYNFFATDQKAKNDEGVGIYNPYDEDDIDRYFGEPFEAAPLREQGELRRKLGIQSLKGVDSDHPLIILRPGERVLGHTHEFHGILPPGMANVYATSTKGRNGLTIAQDATLINPGWVNRLALEIKNENEDEYLPLKVGDRVAQLTYHGTGPVEGRYEDSGSYQHATATDIDAIIRDWTPYAMLPIPKPVNIPPEIPGLSEGYN